MLVTYRGRKFRNEKGRHSNFQKWSGGEIRVRVGPGGVNIHFKGFSGKIQKHNSGKRLKRAPGKFCFFVPLPDGGWPLVRGEGGAGVKVRGWGVVVRMGPRGNLQDDHIGDLIEMSESEIVDEVHVVEEELGMCRNGFPSRASLDPRPPGPRKPPAGSFQASGKKIPRAGGPGSRKGVRLLRENLCNLPPQGG